MKSRALAFGCLLLGAWVGTGRQCAAVVAGSRRRCRREVQRNPGNRGIDPGPCDRRPSRNPVDVGTAGPRTPRYRRPPAAGRRRDRRCRRTQAAAECRCGSQPGARSESGGCLPLERDALALGLRALRRVGRRRCRIDHDYRGDLAVRIRSVPAWIEQGCCFPHRRSS